MNSVFSVVWYNYLCKVVYTAKLSIRWEDRRTTYLDIQEFKYVTFYVPFTLQISKGTSLAKGENKPRKPKTIDTEKNQV